MQIVVVFSQIGSAVRVNRRSAMARTIFLLLVALVFGAQASSSSSTSSTFGAPLGAPGAATTLGATGSTGSTGSSSQAIVARPSSSSTSRSPSTVIVCDLVDQTGTLTNADEVCTPGGLRWGSTIGRSGRSQPRTAR